MDTQKLIDDSRARFSYRESKLYLEEKYQNRLVVTHNGGMFKVDVALLSFLTHAPPEVVIADTYNNPIRVDTPKLLADANSIYTTVMDEWNREWLELRKTR